VAGGGLGLLWVADVVLAAADLKIVTAFAKLGLSGDGGSSWALPRLVGLRRASQLMLGGRVLGAEDARAWGLVDQVVEPANLRIEAEAAAREYADGPTVAYGQMRRLLRGAYHMTWAEQLAAEEAAMVSCGGTDDSREGATALAERRAPKFQGR
jgi:2-(1,2-epoxy-1,2-dihydrophenyl)acetyl-CoA isomerase